MNRLQSKFNKDLAPKLQEKFGYKNVMQIPKMSKIMLNVGIGKYLKDAKFVESIKKDLATVSGHSPVENKARKSVAGFKIREGQVVGLSVTLRGPKMYDFLDKLISVALPRVKDFRGLPATGFDGRGSFHLGLKEHIVFPEISGEALDHIFSLQISLITTAKTDEEAKEMLSLMNFPFKKPVVK